MRSFVDLDRTFGGQPRELSALLARIDTGRGQERLFLDQQPELLKQLSHDARIESITASNAIEGIVVESDRAERIADKTPRFRNRNEQEFAGYRDAIDTLLGQESSEPLSVPLVLHLHRLLFRYSGGRGGYLKTDPNLIVSYERGRREIVFEPPPPEETEFLLTELVERYEAAKKADEAHPLVLVGALILDLLAIHPVADGNGRLARLTTTHEMLACGYGVARYASVEQRIFESKNAYYAALYESQRDWHDGHHDIWPWIAYLVEVIGEAYDDFEDQVASASLPTGSKQEQVRDYVVDRGPAIFRRRDVERALPGISTATIRLVLGQLREEGLIEADSAGPGAVWRRRDPASG